MKDLNEFVDSMVNIDYLENFEAYGHYPFQMFAENQDGTFEISALGIGGTSEQNYNIVRRKLADKPKRIYLSLDFPAAGDIANDFVCVFEISDDNYSSIAIPYSTETGEKFETIKESTHLSTLLEQFKNYVNR